MLCHNCGTNNKTCVKNFTHKTLHIHVYECAGCKKIYAGIKKWFNSVPVPLEIDFPNTYPLRIQKLSPNAVRNYEKALIVRNIGIDDLAGAALRMALENLLWDYLHTVKQIPTKELEGLHLAPMIKKLESLEPETYKNICTVIIKEFGNESIHVNKEFPPISLKDAFRAYEMLCSMMDNYISLLETNKEVVSFLEKRKEKKRLKSKNT